MAYRMEYGMQTCIKTQLRTVRPGKNKSLWKVTLVCVLLAGVILLQMNGGLLELMMPGEGVRAQAAMEQMVQSIREGESVRDAFAAFYLEIVEYE